MSFFSFSSSNSRVNFSLGCVFRSVSTLLLLWCHFNFFLFLSLLFLSLSLSYLLSPEEFHCPIFLVCCGKTRFDPHEDRFIFFFFFSLSITKLPWIFYSNPRAARTIDVLCSAIEKNLERRIKYLGQQENSFPSPSLVPIYIRLFFLIYFTDTRFRCVVIT